MKRNDWKIILTTILFTILFYQQAGGINYFLFSIALVILYSIGNLQVLKSLSWWTSAIGVLLSGFFVFWYGTSLPIIANIISIILFTGFTFHPTSSLFISGFHSLYSIIVSVPFMIFDLANKQEQSEQSTNKKTWWKKVLLLSFPAIVVLLFFFLYRGANPLFSKFTEDIRFDWISLPLIRFCILAFILMYGLFMHHIFKGLYEKDQSSTDQMEAPSDDVPKKGWSIENELFIGGALFFMLNLLIAAVNGLDVVYLWLGKALPEGMTFSEFLHNGTEMLITSIVLAIIIILYFFRGHINFAAKNGFIKAMAYLWIAQNVFMLASTALRNNMYTEAYGLTHKRIGIYVYIILSVVGLCITAVKIFGKRNHWFLYRKNAWAFYLVLILATPFNWDMMITTYNMKHHDQQEIIALDTDYLLSLSHVNTAVMAETAHYPSTQEIMSSYYDYWEEENDGIHDKIYNILAYYHANKWPSYCQSKSNNYCTLTELNRMGKIEALAFSGYRDLSDLSILQPMYNISRLKIASTFLEEDSLHQLGVFENLEALNLHDTYLYSIDKLPAFSHLTHINLSENSIKDYTPLGNIPTLEYVDISSSYLTGTMEFPALPNVTYINLSKNNFSNWLFLQKLPKLEEIVFSNSSGYMSKLDSIPSIPTLRKIDLSSSYLTNNTPLIGMLSSCTQIEDIDLSNNSLSSIYLLYKDSIVENKRFYQEPLFPELQSLDVSTNSLTTIDVVRLSPKLKTLVLYQNSIKDISSLSALTELTELDISNNPVNDFSVLGQLASLQKLKIHNCNMQNVEDIKTLEQLSYLEIYSNNIQQIDSIYSLKSLQYINISNNDIEDISVLSTLSSLEEINIQYNPVRDYSILYDMNHLKKISVGPIDRKIAEELKEHLPDTEIIYFIEEDNGSISSFHYREK